SANYARRDEGEWRTTSARNYLWHRLSARKVPIRVQVEIFRAIGHIAGGSVPRLLCASGTFRRDRRQVSHELDPAVDFSEIRPHAGIGPSVARTAKPDNAYEAQKILALLRGHISAAFDLVGEF